MKHFFNPSQVSLEEKVLLFLRFLIRSCARLEISFDLIFLLFLVKNTRREGREEEQQQQQKKHKLKDTVHKH